MPLRLAVLLCLLAAAPPASAQEFSYGGERPRAVQALFAGYTLLDFTYRGDGEPPVSFAFTEPVYGAAYSRPNFLATFAYGEQSDGDAPPRRLLDLSVTTWGTFSFGERPGPAGRFFVPVALHSDYRRVAAEGQENSLTESFNVTVLGLGAGAGFVAPLGRRAALEARATPILGLAVRSFGDSAGHSRLFDADVQLHVNPIAGRFGLSAGYGFRWQVWSLGSSTLLSNLTADLFDYAGMQHTFRAGVNW